MDKVSIGYYEYSMGNVIRFNFASIEQLKYYKNLIDQVVNDKTDKVNFDNPDIFEALGEIQVVLEKNDLSFIKRGKKKEMNLFTIYQNEEDLVTHSYLLDPLIEKNKPGHQYIEFNNYTLMLSFKES